MNKLIFFKSLEKAVKELPLDDQKMIIKEYEFRYQQEKMKGLKDKEIIASFGLPNEIVEAYLAKGKVEVSVNLNTELTSTDGSTTYQAVYEASKEELITEKEETTVKEEVVVEVNPNLGLEVTSNDETIEEEIVIEEKIDEETEQEITTNKGEETIIVNGEEETIENEKTEVNNEKRFSSKETILEVNPNLKIKVPVKHETVVEEKAEETTKKKSKKEKNKGKKDKKDETKEKKAKPIKKIPAVLIPLWLILIILVLGLDLVIGLLYIPLAFLGFGIFLFGIYVLVGSIMFFMSVNIFNGLFQAGVGILILVLSVVFISLVNFILKKSWKFLDTMFRMMRGK